ncbi:MAG: hypothetical protein JWR83_1268 [Aeromicrobium sp.]|nr:hypothetical protein [Aeromicrobium sp.]
MSQSTGKFMPNSWEESVVADIDGTGATKNGTYYPDRGITSAKVGYAYTGDIEGSGEASYLFAYRDSKAGHADIIGYERFTGKIGDLEGSCVFKHVGKYEEGAVSAHVEVLPGLGTDGLTGLTGSADISMAGAPTDGGFEFTLSYVV